MNVTRIDGLNPIAEARISQPLQPEARKLWKCILKVFREEETFTYVEAWVRKVFNWFSETCKKVS